MVRKKSKAKGLILLSRSAFTMIELIFAIVVIAVTTLTIPMMIQVNNKSLEGSATQEAVFLISAVLSGATTQVWDNRSVSDEGNISLSKILDVNGSGNLVYDRTDVNSTVRVGGLNEDLHRQFYSPYSVNTRPASGSAVEILSNDFDTTATGEELGLKRKYTITVTRMYVADTPAGFNFTTTKSGVQTNIKLTSVVVSADVDGVDEVLSRLNAYTCNIGEVDFAKRRF